MNHFLKSLHSTRGLIKIFIALVGLSLLPTFVSLLLGLLGQEMLMLAAPILSPLLLLCTYAVFAFYLFALHAVLTTSQGHSGWKIFVGIVLVLVIGAVAMESVQWFLSPDLRVGVGYFSGVALPIGALLLFVGLYGLFRAEQGLVSKSNSGSNIVH